MELLTQLSFLLSSEIVPLLCFPGSTLYSIERILKSNNFHTCQESPCWIQAAILHLLEKNGAVALTSAADSCPGDSPAVQSVGKARAVFSGYICSV